MNSLFGAPKPPPPAAPPAPMPTPDDDAIKQAKRKQVSGVQQRSGRASTILSESSSDKLGG